MKILLDTNILMNYPEILEKGELYYVSQGTIEELDYKKESKDNETAYKARRATHYLLKYFDNIKYISNLGVEDLKVDDQLLELARCDNLTLLTSDLILCLKAKIHNINYKLYNYDTTVYTGIQYYPIALDENGYNEELDLMLEKGILPSSIDIHENEFLIVTDKDSNELSIFQYREDKLNVVKRTYISNQYVGSIAARNLEQVCLMSLLNNPKISILCANGSYGAGKTFLTLNYALQELEKGHINKIVFVPNNSYVENSREHGYEPGTATEKELSFLGTIIDIMGEQYVLDAIEKGEIEVVPLATMRGRNFDSSIILVNEAQNLSEDHVKLLIGRVGKNSRIIFDGDQKQTDSALFKNKNGLKLLSKLRDSKVFSKIFGIVKLQKVERSFTAQAADYLDTL